MSRQTDCGEIRLIYRLTRTNAAHGRRDAVSPRLPMTLNVVLKAKGDAKRRAASPVPKSPAAGSPRANCADGRGTGGKAESQRTVRWI